MIFNYNKVTWTTGKASGGDNSGLGGTPAQVYQLASAIYMYYNVGAEPTSFNITLRRLIWLDRQLGGLMKTSSRLRQAPWSFLVNFAAVSHIKSVCTKVCGNEGLWLPFTCLDSRKFTSPLTVLLRASRVLYLWCAWKVLCTSQTNIWQPFTLPRILMKNALPLTRPLAPLTLCQRLVKTAFAESFGESNGKGDFSCSEPSFSPPLIPAQ